MGARTRGLANNVLSSGKLDATDAISGTIAAGNIANASLDNATTYGSVTGGVPAVASDPPSPAEGDIWYNTTTGKLRFVGKFASWATGGSLNTGRRAMSGAGTQTAALGIGGTFQPASPPYTALDKNETESYNGSSWTEVNNLNTGRGYAAGSGTQTSALYFGGLPPSNLALTESWNGTSWTAVNTLNTGRRSQAGAGADNTSALVFGGYDTADLALTEEWNGTSWTEVNDLNTARRQLAGFGIKTSALAATGETTVRLALTESWNGTSWTEVNDTNAVRSGAGSAGADSTSGLIFGGFESAPVDSNVGKTELWNGTSWSEEADLSGPVYYQQQAGAGTATAAISFGGEGSSNQMRTATEEWTIANTNFDVG